MSKYIIAVDQGTTSSRVMIFDERSNIICKTQSEFTQYYPQDGYVLHDPNEIYESVVNLLTTALKEVNIDYDDILGLGITNQRETTVLWDKETGEPIYKAIVWQSLQSKDICDGLEEYKDLIKEKTGLLINPYFSASKIKWMLENVPNAKRLMNEGRLLFGTIDTWITWKLTGGKYHVTDYTNASRTMLFNIKTLSWDDDLLNIFDINKNILPKVINSNDTVGYITDSRISNIANIKICALCGDQESSLLGHTCVNDGDIKITYGTGSFMLLNTGNNICPSDSGLLTTIATAIDGKIQYALEGSVFMCGGAINFMKDNLNIIESFEKSFNAPSSNGVYFVPALTGLAAPYWDPLAKGAILGLTRATTKEEISLATLEAIGYSNKDIIDTMQKETNKKINFISVDGGASKNKRLMQFQSDILSTDIVTLNTEEATALGIFFLVGLNTKLITNIKDYHKNLNVFKPNMDTQMIVDKYSKWKKAIKAVQIFEE